MVRWPPYEVASKFNGCVFQELTKSTENVLFWHVWDPGAQGEARIEKCLPTDPHYIDPPESDDVSLAPVRRTVLEKSYFRGVFLMIEENLNRVLRGSYSAFRASPKVFHMPATSRDETASITLTLPLWHGSFMAQLKICQTFAVVAVVV